MPWLAHEEPTSHRSCLTLFFRSRPARSKGRSVAIAPPATSGLVARCRVMTIRPTVNVPPIPLRSRILGFGSVAPVAAAAIRSWVLDLYWAEQLSYLAIMWGAVVMAFVAGVRRGYGFGAPVAAGTKDVGTAILYFAAAFVALLLADYGRPLDALLSLATSFLLVAILDTRAARTGRAPAHFQKLRAAQMAISSVAYLVLFLRFTVA